MDDQVFPPLMSNWMFWGVFTLGIVVLGFFCLVECSPLWRALCP